MKKTFESKIVKTIKYAEPRSMIKIDEIRQTVSVNRYENVVMVTGTERNGMSYTGMRNHAKKNVEKIKSNTNP